ncbi:MAG: tetratricopeptide repeat protein [Treponema sp.]|nr:tetratricopeptide repeat protein [Treponema sp.]
MSLKSKYKFFALLFSLFVSTSLYSYDLTFKAEPMAIAPFMSAGRTKWDPLGGAGLLSMGVDFFGTLNVGPSFGYFMVLKNNNGELLPSESKFVSLIPFGLQMNLCFYPFARIEFSLGGATGFGIAKNGSDSHFAPWYRGFADLGFRLNPHWTVGAGASYFAYQDDTWFGNPGIGGITAGLSLKFHIETERKNAGAGTVECTSEISDSLFPLFYTMYKENPFGTIYIKNNESAEIRNVVVTFRAEGYTASELKCGSISNIRKRKIKEIPFLADFSKEILRFTEAGKIPGEIIVSYDLLGERKTSVSSVIVPVYNRNLVRWADPQSLAAYISASAPEVLELSKVLVGIARTKLRSGVNRNLQFAMYLFEGMKVAGMKCASDFETPYNRFHVDDTLLDYIQYPYQTIFYNGGDCDDVGILTMALLESVGIHGSYIPVEDDFIVLFDTGVTMDKADRYFNGTSRILEIDGNVWIPLSMRSLQEGFINSWHNAAKTINSLIESEQEISLISLEEAWQVYPSNGFSSTENVSTTVDEKRLIAAAEVDMARYVATEFGPKIEIVQNMIKSGGENADNYNQLGMLYVRAGMYKEATQVYTKSANMGNVTAMNNLGNIASLHKNYLEAKKWYERAIQKDPDNESAKKNLERIMGELE